MKLSYNKNSKDPIYYIQMGVRNGKKVSSKNVARVGKHSELLAITDDPLAYARRQVEKYNKEHESGKIRMSINLDFEEKLSPTDDIASKSTMLNIGYFILQKIYRDLRIYEFFETIKKDYKATFSCNDINRFLTYGRILDPRSKLGTFDRLDTYYEFETTGDGKKRSEDGPSFDYQHILRYMDIMEENFDSYIGHLFAHSNNIVKRNTSVCYFDCTNFYFEIEEEDEDYIDPVTGEVMKGLRKYGRSKQHQPSPLVQMGLFMDGSGIPISMCINSGSDNEQTCAIPTEKKIIDMFGGKPFIYCADAGLGSYDIRNFNSMGDRSFIVTQSIKKLSDVLTKAVFNDYDYKLLSSDARVSIKHMKEFDRFNEKNLPLYNETVYKVLDVENPVDIGLLEEKFFKNGNSKLVKAKAVLKQRIIITFSRKVMEYQRHIRNRQVERAKNILTNNNVEDIKKGPNDVTRFIKRTSVGKNGEKAKDHYRIDQAVIDEEEKYDGYYAVATNLDDHPRDILEINNRRYKIEDCFRIMKTNFRSRPINHRLRTRIIAHFMICYTALLVHRLLECKLDRYGTHFTTENITQTLKNMNVANVQDLYYQAIFKGSQVCTSLNGIFDMGLDKKIYQPKELNKKIKKLLK